MVPRRVEAMPRRGAAGFLAALLAILACAARHVGADEDEPTIGPIVLAHGEEADAFGRAEDAAELALGPAALPGARRSLVGREALVRWCPSCGLPERHVRRPSVAFQGSSKIFFSRRVVRSSASTFKRIEACRRRRCTAGQRDEEGEHRRVPGQEAGGRIPQRGGCRAVQARPERDAVQREGAANRGADRGRETRRRGAFAAAALSAAGAARWLLPSRCQAATARGSINRTLSRQASTHE